MTTASTYDPNLEQYAKLLEGTGQYKVLRQLPPLGAPEHTTAHCERIVAIVDTETTGLDSNEDEVIEFAGIAMTYNLEGDFTGVHSTFTQIREPTVPLSQETIRLTGLTEKILKGATIDTANLENFIRQADLIVAHNAAFDRPFCEQLSPLFKTKPWACSATEIDWKSLGFDGAKLSYLVAHAGWFYTAHRALDDCNALSCLLGIEIPPLGNQTPFKHLLKSARETKTRISFSAPYSLRAKLRARGFRWKVPEAGAPGRWYADFSKEEFQPMIDWLLRHSEVNRRSILTNEITAIDRYRNF